MLRSLLQALGAEVVYANGYKEGQGAALHQGITRMNKSTSVLTKYYLAVRIIEAGFTAFFMDWDVHFFKFPMELTGLQHYDLMVRTLHDAISPSDSLCNKPLESF